MALLANVKRLVALALVVWEPARFAAEALTVFSTLGHRGWLAVFELVAHGAVAALSVMAGLALRNNAPHARALAQTAILACTLRFVQSLYWSVLPSDTVPGDEALYAGVAVALAGLAIAAIRWPSRTA